MNHWVEGKFLKVSSDYIGQQPILEIAQVWMNIKNSQLRVVVWCYTCLCMTLHLSDVMTLHLSDVMTSHLSVYDLTPVWCYDLTPVWCYDLTPVCVCHTCLMLWPYTCLMLWPHTCLMLWPHTCLLCRTGSTRTVRSTTGWVRWRCWRRDWRPPGTNWCRVRPLSPHSRSSSSALSVPPHRWRNRSPPNTIRQRSAEFSWTRL